MSMAPEIETIETIDRRNDPVRSHRLRTHEAPQRVEHLEVEQLGLCREMRGSARRRRSIAPVRVPRTSSMTTDASRTAITALPLSPPIFPYDLGRRGIELDGGKLRES